MDKRVLETTIRTKEKATKTRRLTKPEIASKGKINSKHPYSVPLLPVYPRLLRENFSFLLLHHLALLPFTLARPKRTLTLPNRFKEFLREVKFYAKSKNCMDCLQIKPSVTGI